MEQKKLELKYISKDTERSLTFERLKKGIKKKAYELATLFDVPLCVLIYEQGHNSEPDTFPPNKEQVQAVLMEHYLPILEEEHSGRRALIHLNDVLLEEGKQKSKSNSTTTTTTTAAAANDEWCYPSPALDGFSSEELAKFSSFLEDKLVAVQKKIGMLSGNSTSVGVGSDDGVQWQLSMAGQQPSTMAGAGMDCAATFDHLGCYASGDGGVSCSDI